MWTLIITTLITTSAGTVAISTEDISGFESEYGCTIAGGVIEDNNAWISGRGYDVQTTFSCVDISLVFEIGN